MSKLVLVTGGARSGKSSFAESYLKERYEDVAYLATAIPYDEEMKDRIKKHQQQRPSHWHTYEGHRSLDRRIESLTEQGALLDCVTILVTNLLFDYLGNKPIEEIDTNELEMKITEEIVKVLDACKGYQGDMIMVTNELGSGVVPESKLGRVFRDIAGRVNQKIAKEAKEVYLVVSGIPVKIK